MAEKLLYQLLELTHPVPQPVLDKLQDLVGERRNAFPCRVGWLWVDREDDGIHVTHASDEKSHSRWKFRAHRVIFTGRGAHGVIWHGISAWPVKEEQQLAVVNDLCVLIVDAWDRQAKGSLPIMPWWRVLWGD